MPKPNQISSSQVKEGKTKGTSRLAGTSDRPQRWKHFVISTTIDGASYHPAKLLPAWVLNIFIFFKYFFGQGARILYSPTSSGAVLSGTRPQEWHPMPPSGTFVKIKTTFVFFFTIMIIIMIIILSDTPGWGEGFPDPHRYLHWPPSFFIYFQLIPTISQSIAFYEGCSPKKGGQNGNSKPTNEKSIGFGFLEIFGYRNQTLQVARMSFHFVCSGELWQPVWNPPHPQLLLLQKLLKDEHNCRISKGDYLNLHSPHILFSIEALHLSTIFLHLNICRCAPRWRTTSHRRCTAGTRRPSCHRFPTPSPEGHLEVTWRSPEGHLLLVIACDEPLCAVKFRLEAVCDTPILQRPDLWQSPWIEKCARALSWLIFRIDRLMLRNITDRYSLVPNHPTHSTVKIDLIIPKRSKIPIKRREQSQSAGEEQWELWS